MNIVVTVKQVPDTWAEKKLDPSDMTTDRATVDNVLNEMDEYGVEEALLLKEAHGGEVTAVTMGPDKAGVGAGALATFSPLTYRVAVFPSETSAR